MPDDFLNPEDFLKPRPKRSVSREGHSLTTDWQRETAADLEGRGYTVTSGTRPYAGQSKHASGRALDVRTRNLTQEEGDALKADLEAKGHKVLDERVYRSKNWTAPHLHVSQGDELDQALSRRKASRPVRDEGFLDPAKFVKSQPVPKTEQERAQEQNAILAKRPPIVPPVSTPVRPVIGSYQKSAMQQIAEDVSAQSDARKADSLKRSRQTFTVSKPGTFTIDPNASSPQTQAAVERMAAPYRESARPAPVKPARRPSTPLSRTATVLAKTVLPGLNVFPDETVENFIGQVAQGATETVTDIPKGLAVLAAQGTSLQNQGLPEDLRRDLRSAPIRGVESAVAPLRETVAEQLPIDPNAEGFLTRTLPRAGGSAVPYIAGGLATRGASPLASAMMGVAGAGAQGYEDAKRFTDEDAAIAAGAANSITGLLESVGMGRWMNGIGGKQAVAKRALQVLEEGGQEGLQEWASNVNAVVVSGYDPNRPLSQNVAESALAGLLIGGGVQGAGVTTAALTDSLDARSKVPPVNAEVITPVTEPPMAQPYSQPVQTQVVSNADLMAARNRVPEQTAPASPQSTAAPAQPQATAPAGKSDALSKAAAMAAQYKAQKAVALADQNVSAAQAKYDEAKAQGINDPELLKAIEGSYIKALVARRDLPSTSLDEKKAIQGIINTVRPPKPQKPANVQLKAQGRNVTVPASNTVDSTVIPQPQQPIPTTTPSVTQPAREHVIWQNKDFDLPVTVQGEPQTAPDGRQYVYVENKERNYRGYAPIDELTGGGETPAFVVQSGNAKASPIAQPPISSAPAPSQPRTGAPAQGNQPTSPRTGDISPFTQEELDAALPLRNENAQPVSVVPQTRQVQAPTGSGRRQSSGVQPGGGTGVVRENAGQQGGTAPRTPQRTQAQADPFAGIDLDVPQQRQADRETTAQEPWQRRYADVIASTVAKNTREIETAKRKIAEIEKAAPQLSGNLTRRKDYSDLKTAKSFTDKNRQTSEMLWSEIQRLEKINFDLATPEGRQKAKEGWRKLIEKALREGKPVPAEVLADYPDLQPQQSPQQPDADTDPRRARLAERADRRLRAKSAAGKKPKQALGDNGKIESLGYKKLVDFDTGEVREGLYRHPDWRQWLDVPADADAQAVLDALAQDEFDYDSASQLTIDNWKDAAARAQAKGFSDLADVIENTIAHADVFANRIKRARADETFETMMRHLETLPVSGEQAEQVRAEILAYLGEVGINDKDTSKTATNITDNWLKNTVAARTESRRTRKSSAKGTADVAARDAQPPQAATPSPSPDSRAGSTTGSGEKPSATGDEQNKQPVKPPAPLRETSGWKLHLASDNTEAVSGILRELGLRHKVERSGGQEGKDITVYAGSRDAAQRAADQINQQAGHLLNSPKGDTLTDDVSFGGKVVGRFDAAGDPSFHQYGANGVPFLTEDMSQRVFGDKAPVNELAAKAASQLRAKYGEFYTGTGTRPQPSASGTQQGNEQVTPDNAPLRKPEAPAERATVTPEKARVELARAKADLARAKSATLKDDAQKRIDKYQKIVDKAGFPVQEKAGEQESGKAKNSRIRAAEADLQAIQQQMREVDKSLLTATGRQKDKLGQQYAALAKKEASLTDKLDRLDAQEQKQVKAKLSDIAQKAEETGQPVDAAVKDYLQNQDLPGIEVLTPAQKEELARIAGVNESRPLSLSQVEDMRSREIQLLAAFDATGVSAQREAIDAELRDIRRKLNPHRNRVLATPEVRQQVAESVNKEKISERTGLTKTQSSYLAEKVKASIPMIKEGGLSEVTIPVPGDGEFRVRSEQQAKNLLKRLDAPPLKFSPLASKIIAARDWKPAMSRSAVPSTINDEMNVSGTFPFDMAAKTGGWDGNIVESGEFVTDGKSLARKDALTKAATTLAREADFEHVKVPPQKIAAVMDTSIKEAKTPLQVEGVFVGQPGAADKRDGTNIALLTTGKKGDVPIMVDASRLRTVMDATGATELRGSVEGKAIVMLKDGKPVAVVMPMNRITKGATTYTVDELNDFVKQMRYKDPGGFTSSFLGVGAFAKFNEADIRTIARNFVAHAKDYVSWAKAMIKDFGDTIRPRLRSIWDGLRTFVQDERGVLDEKAIVDGIKGLAKKAGFESNAEYAARKRAEMENSPEFKRWSGDAPIVRAKDTSTHRFRSGKPVVVEAFHGTPFEIRSFDPSMRGRVTEAPSAKAAFFFTSDAETAGDYTTITEGRRAVQLKEKADQLERIAQRSGRNADWTKYEDAYAEYENHVLKQDRATYPEGSNVVPVYVNLSNPMVQDYFGDEYREESFNDVLREARRRGYDGVIFTEAHDPGIPENSKPIEIFAVFSPTQIKSAFNRGTFDSGDANILHSDPLGIQGAYRGAKALKNKYDAIKNRPKKAEEKVPLPADFDPEAFFDGMLGAMQGLAKGKKLTDRQNRQAEKAIDQIVTAIADGDGDALAAGQLALKHALTRRYWHLTDPLRALTASGELGMLLKQGWLGATEHPIVYARTTGKVITRNLLGGKLGQDAELHRFVAKLNADPDLKLMQDATLEIGLAHETDLRKSALSREENALGNWAQNIPVLRQVENINKMGIDALRVGLFKHYKDFLEKNGKSAYVLQDGKRVAHPELVKAARAINMVTGRGDITSQKGQEIVNVLGLGLFSPRFLVSGVQAINPVKNLFTHGKVTDAFRPTTVEGKIAQDYLKRMAYIGMLGVAFKLAGASISGDPDDTDFLQAKFGNLRIPLAQGAMHTQLRFIAQMLKRGYKATTTGEGKQELVKAKNQTATYASSKLAPLAGLLNDQVIKQKEETDVDTGKRVMVGHDFKGHPVTLKESLTDRLPIWWTSVAKQVWGDEKQDPKKAAIALGLEFFGVSARLYDKGAISSELSRNPIKRVWSGTKGLEPTERYRVRVQKAESLVQEFLPALINSDLYKKVPSETQTKLEEHLLEKIEEASFEADVDKRKLTPRAMAEYLKRSEARTNSKSLQQKRELRKF